MKNLIFISLLLFSFELFAYKPKAQVLSYYKSKSGTVMAEMRPRTELDKKRNLVLSRKYQYITLFKKGPYAWLEQGSFPFKIEGYDYISKILVAEDAKTMVMVIDENPMKKMNKAPGIYVVDVSGRVINKYSYFSIYGQTGNFRSSKIGLSKDGKSLTLINQQKVPRSVPLRGF